MGRMNFRIYYFVALSDFYYQSIVGQLHAFGQLCVDLFMQSDSVCAMDEERLLRPYPFGEFDSISEQLVRMMLFLLSERIDHEHFRTFEIRHFCLVDGLHVGNISQFSYSEPQNGHFAMHHHKRQDINVAYANGNMRFQYMKGEKRNPWIEMLREAIREVVLHTLSGILIGIDINRSELAERPDVVDSPHMVVVDMGEKHSVERFEVEGQYLLSEIRSTIDEHPCRLGFEQSRTPKPMVMWVFASAHLTVAPDIGNASRSACAKKSESHDIWYVSV